MLIYYVKMYLNMLRYFIIKVCDALFKIFIHNIHKK